ncbi:hypothetical protein FQA39_LY06248 [Lamprigera yunnana]|nr:hypothetical protein FQA39_LY06248 [Lamprigera yunnana]
MASNGNQSNSKIIPFLNKISAMSKNPQINNELSETLDNVLEELLVEQRYLQNGICNIRFAEMGIFLQASVELYCKRVDILWEDALNYHVKLCSFNALTKEAVREVEMITERMNCNNRKKITKAIIKNSVVSQDLLNDLDHSCKLIQSCTSITINDNLKNVWKNTNENRMKQVNGDYFSDQIEDLTRRQFLTQLTNFKVTIDQSIDSIEGQKIGNYCDLFMNNVTHLSSFNNMAEIDDFLQLYNLDSLLQKYIRYKAVSFQMFWKSRLGDEFALLKEKIQTVDVLLPEEASGAGQHHQGFNAIKKSSERISEPDSVIDDDTFNEVANGPTTPLCTYPQSNVDSGIFEGDMSDECLDNPIYTDMENDLNTSSANIADTVPLIAITSNSTTYSALVQESDIEVLDSTSVQVQDHTESASVQVQVNTESTNVVITPVPVTTISITKAQPKKLEDTPKTQKRKLLNVHENDVSKTEKKTRKYKLPPGASYELKSFEDFFLQNCASYGLKSFEDFFRQNYVAEEGEGIIETSDNIDNETEIALLDISEVHSDIYSQPEDFISTSIESDNENTQPEDLISSSIDLDNQNTQAEHLLSSSIELDNQNTQLEDLISSSIELANQNTQPEDLISSSIDLHNQNTQPEDIISSSIELSNQNTQPEDLISSSIELDNQNTDIIDVEAINRAKEVTNWKNFIQPKLKQMKTSEFDIHMYGKTIMDSIPDGESLNFKNFISQKSASEVSKLFVASLQLVNTGNIEIISQHIGELANDKLEFKLLTRERYHEHLSVFEAPSENSFRVRLKRAQRDGQPSTSTPKRSALNLWKRSRFS